MSINDKWEVLPSVEPLSKEQVLKLAKQAEWDKRVAYYLPKIIERYNFTARKEDRINAEEIQRRNDRNN